MVNNLNLKELLDDENILQRDIALRRAFSAYTGPVDITGYENTALIILLNLTYSRKKIDDLLNKQLAKKSLNNEAHIDGCISEVKWFHTHNLKYPDIRVSKQRLIVTSPNLHPSVLSSANYKQTFGWSHDAAKVNFAKLFGSHFHWQGRVCCLAVLLSEVPQEWKAAFQSLGMSVKSFLNLCGRVKGCLPQVCIPEQIDKCSPQVRMPYHDGYVAITPVISHTLQSEIQQAAKRKLGRYTNIEFTRPAAVSDLVSSLGGYVQVLNYPPRTYEKTHGLSRSRLLQMLNGETVLNLKALMQTQFINGLEGLLSNGLALALKQRRHQKVASNRQIRKTLSDWLAPIFEWRLEIKENHVPLSQLESCYGTLEYQLLTVPDDQLPELLVPVFGLLNTMLSNLTATRKYAFHQRLMTPLRNNLKWLLANIANEESALPGDIDDESPQRYLYLKDIRVFDAQALSNPYCSGIPSLTAVWGMIHHYQRQLNEALGTCIRLTSFSWFIREFSYVAGKKLPEFGMQGPKHNQFRRPGITDNGYCDLVFDLVVHIDGYEDELLLLDTQLEILKASFPANFAGGVMHQPELNFANDWCNIYSDENILYKKLRRLPMSGRWIMPTKVRISNLDELILLLKNNPALCPTMFGYLLLDKPESRANSLERMHCYAEPAVGVVEYATAIDIRLQGIKNYFNRAFWMLDAQEHFMLMKRI
jgi:CRISPR-associated protein Csy2